MKPFLPDVPEEDWLEFHPNMKSKKEMNNLYKTRRYRKSLECSCPFHCAIAQEVDSKLGDYMFSYDGRPYNKDRHVYLQLYRAFHEYSKVYGNYKLA